MGSGLTSVVRKMPVYLAAASELLVTVASCWYALLAVRGQVLMAPWIYLGWLLLHFVTTALLVWVLWRARHLFGLRSKAVLIAYAVTVSWWCVPGPLYFLLTVNLNDLQLRWTTFGWMWELAMVGFVLLGGTAVWLMRPIRAYVERNRVPADPAALYSYIIRYPRNMALVLIASAVFAFIVGNWQISRFSLLPLIEQAKIIVDGFVTALFAGLFYYFLYDLLLSPARARLEEEFDLTAAPRRSFARRILAITLVITIGSLSLISVAVVQASQTLIHRSAQAELARDMAAVRPMLRNLAPADSAARDSVLAALKHGTRGQVFNGVDALSASGIAIEAETLRQLAQQAEGVAADAQVEHKLLGWFTDPASGATVISAVFLTDFYGSLSSALGLYGAIALIVLIMTVLVTAVASQQLARALRRLTQVVRQAQASDRPFVYDPHTADELEELAHAFAYYSATVLERTTALQEAVKHLQELDQVKSEFISTASHQLRTPLTGLKWCYAGLLRGDFGPLQQAQREVAQLGLDKTIFMINLVNSFLNVAHMDDTTMKLQFSSIDVPKLLQKLIADLDSLIRQKRIIMTLTLPPYSVAPLQADRDQLSIVLSNLLDNAIKYTPAGGTVTVRVTSDSHALRVAVADTGIGIPPDIQHRLFTKFFRAPNAMTMHTDGSGLGLYITKRIIEHHGGRIEVKSELNRGTTFTVTLPVKPPQVN